MKKTIQRLAKSDIVRGSMIFTLGNFAISIINYVSNLLIARLFPLEVYGEYVAAYSYLAILTVPLTSLSLFIVKTISEQKSEHKDDEIARVFKVLNLTITKYSPWIMLIGSVFTVIMVNKSNLAIPSIFFIILSAALSVWYVFFNSAIQAKKQFFLSSLFQGSSSLVRLFAILVIGLVSPSLNSIFAIGLLSTLIIISLTKKLMIRDSAKVTKTYNVSLKNFVQRKYIIPVIGALGVVGLINTDIILTKMFFSDEQASLYASLSMMGRIITYISAPVTIVAYTFFSSKEKSNNKRIGVFSISLFLLVGLCMTLIYGIAPQLLINIVFGPKFASVAKDIWIAGVFGTIYSVIQFITYKHVSANSYSSLYPVIFIATQTIAIYVFHESIRQVMVISSINLAILLAVYVLDYLRRSHQAIIKHK